MKYIRRSVKYFIQLTLIFTVLIAILMLSGMVEKDVAAAFRRGWDDQQQHRQGGIDAAAVEQHAGGMGEACGDDHRKKEHQRDPKRR